MTSQPTARAKVILRLQEAPNEDLSVNTAFVKQPKVVQDALLEAIRQVPLRSINITLLRIQNEFLSALEKP